MHTVVNNPVGAFDITTYKLASPGHTLGSIFTDGVSAVAGQIGPLPERTHLTVRAENADGGETHDRGERDSGRVCDRDAGQRQLGRALRRRRHRSGRAFAAWAATSPD